MSPESNILVGFAWFRLPGLAFRLYLAQKQLGFAIGFAWFRVAGLTLRLHLVQHQAALTLGFAWLCVAMSMYPDESPVFCLLSLYAHEHGRSSPQAGQIWAAAKRLRCAWAGWLRGAGLLSLRGSEPRAPRSYTGSVTCTATQLASIQFKSAVLKPDRSQLFVVKMIGVRQRKTSYVYICVADWPRMAP